MKRHYNVIIVVIASRGEYYNKLADAWSKLFNRSDKVKVLLVYGNDSGVKSSSNIVVAPFKETRVPGILKKTVYGFEHCLSNYSFDFIFRTNLSSFTSIKLISEYVKELPKSGCYCGAHWGINKNLRGKLDKLGIKSKFSWCHGAGFFLSKDLVSLMVKQKDRLDYRIIDDVAIGLFFKDIAGVKRVKMRRGMCVGKVKRDEEVRWQTIKRVTNEIMSKKLFHVRIRTNHNRIDFDFGIFNRFVKLKY